MTRGEFRDLPTEPRLRADGRPRPIPPGERRRLALGWAALTCGMWCVCLVVWGAMDAWARETPGRPWLLAYIVAGGLFVALGAVLLYGLDWLRGPEELTPAEPVGPPVCDDCGEGMNLVGDVWVCWHCCRREGVRDGEVPEEAGRN